MFFRLHTDGTRTPAAHLVGQYAGPWRTACWLIGGGPSLAEVDVAGIAASPVAKFAVNLAGHGLLRPDLWTSYDPSARFHRSTYLDASIVKFVHVRRGMDLVPGTTFKVCECPNLYCLERDTGRGFADFLECECRRASPRAALSCGGCGPRRGPPTLGIVDWNDSLVQGIDIAYRLGFRVLYLAGCEMLVRPAEEHISRAAAMGVEYTPRETLEGFYARCERAGLSRAELEQAALPRQYHFDEQKPLAAAIRTDLHYFRVSQYLRLARRSLALAGMELVSVTPESRLNDYFPYRPVEQVLREIAETVGDPARETTRGQYTSTGTRGAEGLGPMRDFRPHHWPKTPPAQDDVGRNGAPCSRCADRKVRRPSAESGKAAARAKVRQALEELPEIEVRINEVG